MGALRRANAERFGEMEDKDNSATPARFHSALWFGLRTRPERLLAIQRQCLSLSLSLSLSFFPSLSLYRALSRSPCRSLSLMKLARSDAPRPSASARWRTKSTVRPPHVTPYTLQSTPYTLHHASETRTTNHETRNPETPPPDTRKHVREMEGRGNSEKNSRFHAALGFMRLCSSSVTPKSQKPVRY